MNIRQKILEKKLQNILLQLLNGHFDLVPKILFFKKEFEYDIIKNQKIDSDFVNWLSYDILLRSSLIMEPYYQDYYLNNLDNLGLNKCDDYGFRRIKSLNDCFKLKWWMTTGKNNLEWKKIHKIIKLLPFITVWKLENQSFDNINNIWSSPNINDIKQLYNVLENNILTIDLYEKNFYYLIDNFIVHFS